MSTVILLTLLFVSVIMTGLILIQQSEGGALGIGGGGGGGGFMSGRSAANSVSRMTGILGGAFLVLCLLLTIVMNKESTTKSILDEANAEAPLTATSESVEDTIPLGDANDVASDAETIVDSETVVDGTETTEDAQETPKKPELE